MPQVLSIPPSTESVPPRTSPSNASSESGSSKFDEALDSARQKNSTDSPNTQHPSDSTNQSAETDKSKPAKPVCAKPAIKARIARAEESDDATSTEDPAHPATSEAASANTAATAVEQPQPADPKGVLKAKDPAHATDPKADSQASQIALAQQQNPAVKPVDPDAKRNKNPSEDPPSEPVQAVEKAPAALDVATAQDAQATEKATSSAKPAPATPAKASPLKPGGAVDSRSRSPSENASESTSPNTAANAAIATLDAETLDGGSTQQASEAQDAPAPASKTGARPAAQSFADTLQSLQDQAPVKASVQPGSPAGADAPQTPREIQFADVNHDRIVSGVHTQLLPDGGTMQIRLDPPELGAMNVSVHMKDGVMTATFETSNDQASRLLSHSLGQLKTALESEGVTVGRLHVQQAPRDSESRSSQDGKSGEEGKQSTSQQHHEQQRREMLRRMWRRVNGGKDPLDLVA